ncbi:hypothetical protein [Microbacterium oleivorans]|uniref:Glycine zipper-like domain-containing protein n=1 Tax=Microbacterium oleivorans TaxID=273677 RepID=A0A031FKZ1_9MICO|nr:hypothetical protein [Microbacterium oleivorans]AZS43295.1 hypothetical protein BWL13_00848 [Microbacterium oleivorans]EZP25253.1 hypothetical protein BW34_02707 [Microbacterium oleivorans]
MANKDMRGMTFGLWIAFGMLGGAIAGMLFLDNIGLGAAFGLSFGIMFGILFSSQKSTK